MTAYSRLLESTLIPLYYRARGRAYPARREFLERSQWWSSGQIAEFQWRETARLLDLAFAKVPYYQEKYKAAGIRRDDIQSTSDFRRLPPLSREELNENRERLRPAGHTGKVFAHATGGSSGVPARFYVSMGSYDWRSATTARAYSWASAGPGEKTLYLWGAPIGTPSAWKRTKTGLYRLMRRELVFSTFLQTDALWQQIYDSAVRFRPTAVVGYVSSLEQFCHFLIDHNLKLDGIKGVIAAAEPVFEPTRELVFRALGAPLSNTYGSREFMSIAAECDRHDGLHVHAENLLVETEADGNQAPSELLVTDLHNDGMVFLRYRIGDVGWFSGTPCSCGRGLPLLKSVEGRKLDVLRAPDGRIVPGELIPHLIKDIQEVREYQAEQKRPDLIVLSVVLNGPLSEHSQNLLHSELSKAFGAGVTVEIQPVDAIARRPSGKRQVTIGLRD
jgi:phenylacetate-CoA ligase